MSLLLTGKRVLILGFFFRNNLGDDTYVYVFDRLLRGADVGQLTFVSMDDLQPQHVCDADVVICGGGDIINDYFIRKLLRVEKLLLSKPCYAVSVGIAYAHDARLVDVFDHVYVRSSACMDLAAGRRVPVTLMPDLAFALSPPPPPAAGAADQKYNLAVCLAQPVFRARPELLKSMAQAIIATAESLAMMA